MAAVVFDLFIAITLSPQMLAEPYIVNSWSTMRDIANLAFIFGMIVVGFMMITAGALGDWKKTLMRLIIVALLLNFSLFFSRVVIDAGNILGGFFYHQIAQTDGMGSNTKAAEQGFAVDMQS